MDAESKENDEGKKDRKEKEKDKEKEGQDNGEDDRGKEGGAGGGRSGGGAGAPVVTELLLILKWGGVLTHAGRRQAEDLGKNFRMSMYPR